MNSPTAAKTPALKYIRLVRGRMAAVRGDMPAIIRLAERMARPLLDGGNLFVPQVADYWPGEFSGRAGGFMGVKGWSYAARSQKDVALLALPDPRRPDARAEQELRKLIAGKAQLFVLGRRQDLPPFAPARRFAGFTGGVDAGEGLYGTQAVRPLAPLRPFEQLIRGWTLAGELIGACTRGGSMPVIWMSIWLEGAPGRNASFMRTGNLAEPHPNAPLFHEDRFIPPLPRGYASGEFLRHLDGIIAALESQSSAIAKAGAWMAQAARTGHRIRAVAAGHCYPAILERPAEASYPIEWGPPVSNILAAVPETFGPGDVAMHLGYGPVNADHVRQVLDRGVRFIHTSPYGRARGLKAHRSFLWLDLPWRPADATVDVPGYGVRILPASSSADTVAYFAVLCEMAQRMGWT
jgi:hypothetical protein